MREFEDYLACGRLENGFLRVRCHSCSHSLPIHKRTNNSRILEGAIDNCADLSESKTGIVQQWLQACIFSRDRNCSME